MWQPVKTDIETEKSIILGIAKNEIEKKLKRVNKKIDKLSEEYFKMDPFKDTPRQLTNKRLQLEAGCEERDRLQRRLEIIEEWKGEIQ